jgi:hypothetical protein
MRNIKNLVFIKHENDIKKYLFEVPLDVELKVGNKVMCNTIRGNSMGVCVTDSFIVDNVSARNIISAFEAYEPLKYILGYAREKTEYEVQYFDLPF